jgi:hypothetical protein
MAVKINIVMANDSTVRLVFKIQIVGKKENIKVAKYEEGLSRKNLDNFKKRKIEIIPNKRAVRLAEYSHPTLNRYSKE